MAAGHHEIVWTSLIPGLNTVEQILQKATGMEEPAFHVSNDLLITAIILTLVFLPEIRNKLAFCVFQFDEDRQEDLLLFSTPR